jgi:hypothetical protein
MCMASTEDWDVTLELVVRDSRSPLSLGLTFSHLQGGLLGVLRKAGSLR